MPSLSGLLSRQFHARREVNGRAPAHVGKQVHTDSVSDAWRVLNMGGLAVEPDDCCWTRRRTSTAGNPSRVSWNASSTLVTSRSFEEPVSGEARCV